MAASKLQVGVVDDNRSVAEIISEILGTRDFTCFDAYDGRGAIEMVKAHALDLLILDFILPDVDGLQVLRTLEAHGFKVPTILVTGALEPPDGFGASPLVRAVLRKPFTGSELRRMVAEVTGRALP